jgi:hypothetical protein
VIDFQINWPTRQETALRLTNRYRQRRTQMMLELFSMIVLATPVAYGEARGGWRISVGGPVSQPDGSIDPDGHATIAEGLAALEGAPPFADIWISNPVEHVPYLENGWSQQAPHGMVMVSLAAWKSYYAGEVQ